MKSKTDTLDTPTIPSLSGAAQALEIGENLRDFNGFFFFFNIFGVCKCCIRDFLGGLLLFGLCLFFFSLSVFRMYLYAFLHYFLYSK